METYRGVKFKYQRAKSTFDYDHRLVSLNRWAYLFSQLGLAPVHSDGDVVGAYGNQSYRTGKKSFIITKSAMVPAETLQLDNFCHITNFTEQPPAFMIEGASPPSSESFLHNALYQAQPHINAILHGHCALLNIHAESLNIPVTREFQDYGTPALAQSALDLLDRTTLFFILRDHGFVAMGEDIGSAGRMTLHFFSELISLLQIS